MTGDQDALFLRMFSIVLGALIAFTLAIIVLANVFSPRSDSSADPLVVDMMKRQLGPVGQSRVGD